MNRNKFVLLVLLLYFFHSYLPLIMWTGSSFSNSDKNYSYTTLTENEETYVLDVKRNLPRLTPISNIFGKVEVQKNIVKTEFSTILSEMKLLFLAFTPLILIQSFFSIYYSTDG